MQEYFSIVFGAFLMHFVEFPPRISDIVEYIFPAVGLQCNVLWFMDDWCCRTRHIQRIVHVSVIIVHLRQVRVDHPVFTVDYELKLVLILRFQNWKS